MRPLATALLVLAALLTGAANARAQAPSLDTARLAYARPEGAGCLAEWAFRAMVAGNLAGRDPFADDASRHISVTVRRGSRGGFVGVATEHDATGKSLGTREMTGRTCEGLTDSMAIVVSSWLLSIPRRKPPAPPSVEKCAPAPEAPAPAPPAPMCVPVRVPMAPVPAPAPRPLVVVEVGSLLSLATVPRRPGFGLVGAVGLRWPAFSIALEARGDVPSATSVVRAPTGPTYGSAWILSGTLAPCLHAGWFVGCALGSGGVLTTEHGWNGGQVGNPHAYAAIGLRAGIQIPLAQRIALSASADLRASLVAHDLRLGHVVAWALPTVEGAFGLRFLATFGGP